MEEKILNLLNKSFILASVLIVGVLIFFVGELSLGKKALDQQNTYQITVSGQGKIYAKPDIAVISFGVTTEATTVADATTNNTNKMNTVIEAIKNQGVEDKDIQTTNYSLNPIYGKVTTPLPTVYREDINPSSAPVSTSTKITGYKLNQEVEVKIRDFAKVGDIISGATSAGSNSVSSLQFTIDNPEQFREQARAKAIAQAKSNAKNLAKESGVKLGKIINVYESNYYMPYAYDSMKGMGGASLESAPVPTIQPGEQEINITVNLTYQVK